MLYLTGTNLVFKVFPGIGNFNVTTTYTHSIADDAPDFDTSSTYTCGGKPYPGLTNYVEVYDIKTNAGYDAPPWSIWFNDTNVAWWGSGSWSIAGLLDSSYIKTEYADPGCSCSVPSFPHGFYKVFYGGWGARLMTFANQGDAIWFDHITFTITHGSGFTATGGMVGRIGTACSGNTCTIGTGTSCSLPWVTGLSGSCGWSSYVGMGLSLSLTTSSNTPTGTYTGKFVIVVTSYSPTETTTWQWSVAVT